MILLGSLRRAFIERFAAAPEFFQAPGRVNLIGEHTDYNAGFVMPAAIQFRTIVGIAERKDRCLQIHSTNFNATVTQPLDEIPSLPPARRERHWVDYVIGVASVLRERGAKLRGADILIHGEVPLGSGLSSSAALEVAVALALAFVAKYPIDPLTLAQVGQRAENDYVGNRCGIMDQLASACGRAGHALWIDCRSLTLELLPLQRHMHGVKLVVCNTMVRHQLAGSQYNRRREECEQGVRALSGFLPGIRTLRDLSIDDLMGQVERLDPLVFRRCHHVVTENARVCSAAAALEASDLDRFGQLMRESHRSLRDDYQVSCEELDLMVEMASSIGGVFGARMTGGGFGGCTVNLVRADAVDNFVGHLSDSYARATGHRPEIYVCEAVDGASHLVES